MRVSKDEFVNDLRRLDKNLMIGRLAHALLDSGIPFPLAIQLLGCSRASLYGWLRLQKRISRRHAGSVEKLTRALTTAIAQGSVPCHTEAEYIKALITALSTDN